MKYTVSLIIFICLSLFVVWLFLSLIHYEWLTIPNPFAWWISSDTSAYARFVFLVIALVYLFISINVSINLLDEWEDG